MKKSELAFCLISIMSASALGCAVLTTNPEFKLQDIALLKTFYVALLHVCIFGFILCLRGVKEDMLAGIWVNPIAKAIVLMGYMVSVGLVIGK